MGKKWLFGWYDRFIYWVLDVVEFLSLQLFAADKQKKIIA